MWIAFFCWDTFAGFSLFSRQSAGSTRGRFLPNTAKQMQKDWRARDADAKLKTSPLTSSQMFAGSEEKCGSRIPSFHPIPPLLRSYAPPLRVAAFQPFSQSLATNIYKNIICKERACWTCSQNYSFSKSHLPFSGRIEWPHLRPAYGEGRSEGPAHTYPQGCCQSVKIS